MARKKPTQEAKNGQWKGFVTVPLPSTVTADVCEKACDGLATEDIINELVGRSLKVSLSELRSGDGYVCALTGKDGAGENTGYTTTTFAGTVRRALLGAWYKAAVICGWGAWETEERQNGLEL